VKGDGGGRTMEREKRGRRDEDVPKAGRATLMAFKRDSNSFKAILFGVP
jgi:hypothetical protein